jgi:hypothetical protein
MPHRETVMSSTVLLSSSAEQGVGEEEEEVEADRASFLSAPR